MRKGMIFNARANATAELYIEGEIGGWGIYASELRRELNAMGDLQSLTVYLNSPGGSVVEGLNIYNLIKRLDAEVTVVITGMAASMGSVIAMAADKTVMAEGTLMMIHNPWGGAVGEADDLRKVADILDKMKASLIGTYHAKSGVSRDEIAALMTAETWMDTTEAKELGFIDAIEGDIDADNIVTIDEAKALVAAIDKPKQEIHRLAAMVNPNLSTDKAGFYNLNDLVNRSVTPPNAQPIPKPTQTEDSIMDELEKQKAAIKARNTSIVKMFAKHTQLTSLQADCLADTDLTLDAVKDKLLEALGANPNNQPVGGLQVIEDAVDKFKDGAVLALSARAGLATRDNHNEFLGYSLAELARKSLELSGHRSTADKMAMIGQAFTHSTGDFGSILSNVANKAMLKGFEESPEVFDQFTAVGTLSDFKETTRVDIGPAPSLRPVKENAEFKHITMGDREESAMLATFGELFSISRQAIINDDLSVFTRIPGKFGRAARRTVGDLVFAQLVAPGNYSATNSITGEALSTAAMDKLRLKMILAKEGKITTGVRPAFLITPETLSSTAKTELAREFIDDKQTPNPVRNIVTPISDYRLDVEPTQYYMLADPNMYDAMEVLYLNGNSNPFLDQMTGWTIDGAQFKVRIDAAAKLWDKRSTARGKA